MREGRGTHQHVLRRAAELDDENVDEALQKVDERVLQEVENHEHAVALHVFNYNFIRKYQTLKTTPAVAAGIANAALTVLDLVKMIEAEVAKLGARLTS